VPGWSLGAAQSELKKADETAYRIVPKQGSCTILWADFVWIRSENNFCLQMAVGSRKVTFAASSIPGSPVRETKLVKTAFFVQLRPTSQELLSQLTKLFGYREGVL
jgi:hypothetical protein